MEQCAAGYAFQACQDYEHVLPIWSDLSKNYPDDLTFLYELGHAFYRLSHLEEAVSCFLRLLLLDPLHLDAHLFLGLCHLRQEEYQKAEEQFSYVLEHAPSYQDAHEGLAQIKKYQTAAFDSEAQHAIGDARAYEKAYHYRRALAIWQGLHEACPENVMYLRQMGKLYTWMGCYREAGQMLDQALALSPDDADTQLVLGYLDAARGHMSCAYERFFKIVQKHPHAQEPLQALARAEASLGCFCAARSTLQTYLKHQSCLSLDRDFEHLSYSVSQRTRPVFQESVMYAGTYSIFS